MQALDDLSSLSAEPLPLTTGRGRWRRLAGRPASVAGGIVISLFVLSALLAHWIVPHSTTEPSGDAFAPPSLSHLLGTDDRGVDVLSLLVVGGRASLFVGFAATLIASVVGTIVGVCAGYFGGRLDTTLMRITDYFLVIPDIALMIAIAAIWGQSLWHIVLIIALLGWTWTARVVRSEVRSVRERTYIRRVRSLGAGHLHTLAHHVVPQVAPLIAATATLGVAVAIFSETALAYLGLSDPTVDSWGKMIRDAQSATAVSVGAWWAIVPPGVAVALVVLSCTLVGQTIEDALNPRLKVSYLAARGFRFSTRFDDK